MVGAACAAGAVATACAASRTNPPAELLIMVRARDHFMVGSCSFFTLRVGCAQTGRITKLLPWRVCTATANGSAMIVASSVARLPFAGRYTVVVVSCDAPFPEAVPREPVEGPDRASRRAGSGADLFDEQAHGEVDAQRADLVAAQVVDDRVRDADVPAGGRDAGELAGVGAHEVGLDRGLAVVGEQVLQFRPGVERLLVDVPDQLPGGVPPAGALVGAFEGGHGVVGEIGGVIGALDQGVQVVLHDLPFGTHCRSPFPSRSFAGGLVR